MPHGPVVRPWEVPKHLLVGGDFGCFGQTPQALSISPGSQPWQDIGKRAYVRILRLWGGLCVHKQTAKCHARSHTLLTVAMDKKVLGAILNTASWP